MRKTILFSFVIVSLSACGKTESPEWASGIPSDGSAPENEILSPVDQIVTEDAATIAELVKPAAKPVYFSINPAPVKLNHGTGVTWVGCDETALVRGGYASDTKCGRAFFHPRFEKQMNVRFYLCAERAASKANIARPSKIFVNHMGSYNDRLGRGSSSLSMHAYARALDIANFNLHDGTKVTKISTHVRNFKGVTKTFYNEFRQCWKEAMPSTCKAGKSEYKGSIGIPSSALGGNSLHNDHIHLSYALCAG
ncbi:MAG TPA: extensin family protein [Bdellovibrionales bacterium]|nr:extensin family protein [Bdellovibrionales bacterium]